MRLDASLIRGAEKEETSLHELYDEQATREWTGDELRTQMQLLMIREKIGPEDVFKAWDADRSSSLSKKEWLSRMRRLFRWRPALMLTTGLDEGIRLWDTRVCGPAGDVFDLMVEDQAASPGGSPPGSPGSLGSAEVNEAKELRFEQFEKWVEVGWVETTRAAQERRARVSREEEVMTDLVEQARIADEVKTEEESD